MADENGVMGMGGQAIPVTSRNSVTLREEARKKVHETSETSKIFDPEAEIRFPRFEQREINLGRVLGRGGFCVVNEISAFHLSPGDATEKAPRYDNEQTDRSFVQSHCIRKGDARYALKQLDMATKRDAHRYLKGIMDLAIEVKFLAVLENPHIIKMRAYSDRDPYEEGYFVVLDRLYDTLERRCFVWRRRKSSIATKISQKRKNDLVLSRLLVAYDLCSALLYLHRQRIIYRDIKPENIGFDVRDDVKIFDFGLAKELHLTDAIDPALGDGALYKMTGLTGSLRYMAPEVATFRPYNFTADVYSFGILLWQILALDQPFRGYSVNMHNELVVHKGYRPAIKASWPLGWGILLKNCWSPNLEERPGFQDVSDALRGDICLLRGDEDDMLDQTRRSLRSL